MVVNKILLLSNNRLKSLSTNNINNVTSMTSNTTPSPLVASASSVYDSTNYLAWKAFNGTNASNTDCWMTVNNTITGYIQIDYGVSKKANKLTLTSRNDAVASIASPKEFKILGSNDNITFIDLATFIGETIWTSNQTKIFKFNNEQSFRYYRLQIISNNGATYSAVGEILYSYESLTENELIGLSDNNFITYGASTLDNFNRIIKEKKYILQNLYIQKDANGLWIQQANRKPLSVNLTGSSNARLAIQVGGFYYTITGGVLTLLSDGLPATIQTNGFTTATITNDMYVTISQNPIFVIYSDVTTDLILSTTTEPYEIYDELGSTVDVLYYTDDTTKTTADLSLTGNWSPIDELNDDFEILTWTNEENITKTLETTATPKPQFIKMVESKTIYNNLDGIISTDLSTSYKVNKDNIKFLFAGSNSTIWYRYDTLSQSFIVVDSSTIDLIKQNGMTYDEVNSLSSTDWNKWSEQYINIGLFLEDNARNTVISQADNLSYKDLIPNKTSKLSDTTFYILNTTARIDINFSGLTLLGNVSDDDLTRVQYRVKLNGTPYYPANGDFTELSDPPQNIAITLLSSEVVIDGTNTIEVEFRDFFGTTDSWSANFIGTYAGLIFKDTSGNYYSTEIGQVLQFLDFGQVLTGQITPTYEIILKNQYGYNVKDLILSADTSNFASGLELEFDTDSSFSNPRNQLSIFTLSDTDEIHFFLRMKSPLTTEPNGNNQFDITVTATRDV